jgi:hypothetical protein
MEGTLYLHLFHGRTDPEQQMNEWGTDGPYIGPTYIGWTYGGLKVNHEHLLQKEDMIYYDGVYYGDCCVLTTEEMEAHRKHDNTVKTVSEEEFAKQVRIDASNLAGSKVTKTYI